MTNYLARIAARAHGTPDAENIKPVIRSRPLDNSDSSSNPFKEETAPANIFPDHEDRPLPEDRSQLQPKAENPAISLPPYDEKYRPDNIGRPVFDQPNKIIQPSPSDESIAPLSPSDAINRSLNIDQPVVDERPEGIDVPVSKKTEKAEKVIPDSDSFSPVSRPFFEIGLIHKQPLRQDLENKKIIKKQHIPVPDKTNLEPVLQSAVESSVPDLSPNTLKENKRSVRESNAPVQILHPPAPIDSTPSPVPKKNLREPQLVIGRVKVEVVIPPPAVKKQPPIRKILRSFKSQQNHNKINSGSNLRFGMGQI